MDDLRSKAEKLLQLENSELTNQIDDVKKLMHELQVYQIELDLQNQQMQEYTEQLKSAERKFFTIFNYAPIAYFLFDTKAVITDCNLEATQMLANNKEALLGKPMVSYIAGGKKDKFYTFIDDVIQESTPQKAEFEVNSPDNTIILLEISAVFVKDNFILAAANDITKKREQSRFLKDALKRAEESDKMKTDFLNNISHEIRTPLNAITGFSELICKERTTREKRLQYAHSIIKGSKQLIKIIEDILVISRLSHDDVAIHKTTFSLASFLADIEMLYKLKYEDSSQVDFCIKETSGKKIMLETDQDKLLNIIERLLENSFKFTNEGKINIDYNISESDIVLRIKDSGKGINQKDQKRLFKPFIKVEEHSRFNSGLGLGLSIAKGYADLLGGDVWYENSEEHSSVFCVAIPIIQNNDSIVKQTETNVKNIDLTKKTILIAEDEHLNFSLLEEIFSEFEVNVLHAENGLEAVDIYKKESIDIVIMDLKMPVMNGIQAAKKIRRINKDAIIVALSAHIDTATDKDVRKLFNKFIFKPIDIELTLKKISSLLN